MHTQLPQDVQLLLMVFCLLGGLFLIALIRMLLLSRSNRQLLLNNAKLDRQALDQQIEITAVHHDAMSWRAKMQRQFDAFRADLSHRLQRSEQGNLYALGQLEAAHGKSLTAALTKISELEARLAVRPAAAVLPVTALPDTSELPKPELPKPVAIKPPPTLPALPSMETLRIQALESELTAAKAELAASKRQTTFLQHALQLARRKQTTRKGSMRPSARAM